MLTISPIPAFSDNYIWLVQSGKSAVVVDPGEPEPVLRALSERQVDLTDILITHHHHDHTGAVSRLKDETGCILWGPSGSPAGPFDYMLAEGDTVEVLGTTFDVLAVPGHTLDHIAYFSEFEKALFCGDTLFVGGCGRVFEGTAPQMRASLKKLAQLPSDTRAFCAHEYTLANLRFALQVEPGNQMLREKLRACEDKRRDNIPTVPSLIGEEIGYNPFLRWDSDAIRHTLLKQERLLEDTEDGVFAAVREWKNTA
ncbi:MAG: hydroxyacylglutathione hydrolase [Luminiphilus sp.]|nr:hydroxyacylglutathione hydrolase [Luminiphilus sp.]